MGKPITRRPRIATDGDGRVPQPSHSLPEVAGAGAFKPALPSPAKVLLPCRLLAALLRFGAVSAERAASFLRRFCCTRMVSFIKTKPKHIKTSKRKTASGAADFTPSYNSPTAFGVSTGARPLRGGGAEAAREAQDAAPARAPLTWAHL